MCDTLRLSLCLFTLEMKNKKNEYSGTSLIQNWEGKNTIRVIEMHNPELRDIKDRNWLMHPFLTVRVVFYEDDVDVQSSVMSARKLGSDHSTS